MLFMGRWLGSWFIGMMGVVFLRIACQAEYSLKSEFFDSTQFGELAIIVFVAFFAIGYSIIGLGQMAVKRLEYYEQTIRFQNQFPHGRLATGDYDGAEQL